MNKDEILDKIVKLQQEIVSYDTQHQELNKRLTNVEEVKEDLKFQYEEIKTKYFDAERTYQGIKQDINTFKHAFSGKRSELETLQRELSRAYDAEKLKEEYDALVKKFQEKCLDAPWRKENREDGKGALEHQIEGAINLAIAQQGILGDKRGLGKTLTSLITADFNEARKVICIVPSDTVDNFIREIQMWTPHRRPLKLSKMSKQERDFLLPQLVNFPEYMLVMNYESWRRDRQLIKDLVNLKADMLLLDEAHRIKSWEKITCRGVMEIRFTPNICPNCDVDPVDVKLNNNDVALATEGTCKHCEYHGNLTEFNSIKYVLPMTGTPILNRPQELFPLLKLIDPNNYRTPKNFLVDFCYQGYDGKWTWRLGGEKKLLEKVGPRYVGRNRKDAGVIIPPPTPVEHLIEKDYVRENYPRQFDAYEQARRFAEIVLDPDRELVLSMTMFIAVLTRLRQVINWPAGIELKITNEETGEQEVVATLDVKESAKLDKAEEIIREAIDEGDRVVLFSQFNAPLQELQRRLGPRAALYAGRHITPDGIRTRILNDFDPNQYPSQSGNYNYDVVLGNYKAMGEGLNLQSATQMVILDEEWNPGRQEQAYGRIDRMGQTKETIIHTIRVEGSVDKWMQNLIEMKRQIVSGFEDNAKLYRAAYDALRNGEL